MSGSTRTPLVDLVNPRVSYARSVNVERTGAAVAVLGGYIPTDRAVEALERVFGALLDPNQPRAWTITGPYGSGKSSFAAFLTALLAEEKNDGHRVALERLAAQHQGLEAKLLDIRQALRVRERGFILGVAASQREPVANTVARALANGVRRRWSGPGRRPRAVTAIRSLAEQTGNIDPAAVYEAFLDLAAGSRESRPILLIIDEFGKNLEYAAERPYAGDLYLLQQIAEAFSGSDHLADGSLITFQHLAFADYAFGLPVAQMQEWNKVQGRFEDISFLESRDQTIQLIDAAIDVSRSDKRFQRDVRDWAERARSEVDRLDLFKYLPADAAQIAGCYPLHPLSIAVLPDLTTTYGQHDRSLFTFLSSNEPHSLPWFVKRGAYEPDRLPLLGLADVYDYFVAALGETAGSGAQASRWLEIQTAVRSVHGLSSAELTVLKTIAILNLVSTGGPLRASADVLRFASDGSLEEGFFERAVDRLEERSLITYRRFADEYRVWQGSDFDIAEAVAAHRDRLASTDIIPELAQGLPLMPLVAQRHAHETGTLRYFERRYADSVVTPGPTEPNGTVGDGLVLYLLGDSTDTPPATTSEGKPLIVCSSPDLPRVRDAALELLALNAVLQMEELRGDPVALREVRHRASLAQKELHSRLEAAFSPSRSDTLWQNGERVLRVRSPRTLSAALSDLADEYFPSAPRLHNEMLNRAQLTSQGAKARRVLIEAMLEREALPQFGITGYGPGRAMYESVFHATGIHSEVAGQWMLKPPTKGSGLRATWNAIARQLRSAVEVPLSLGEVSSVLTAPPFGAREGLIPILLVAALQYLKDEVAIYQDGSFEPLLTADLAERLVKIPDRFSVRHVQPLGPRQPVVEALRKKFKVASSGTLALRNSTLLGVIRPLITTTLRLPEWARNTKTVSPEARAVRTVLLQTREPDQLLFEDLPVACGLEPIPATGASSVLQADEFANRLHAALEELVEAHNELRRSILSEVKSVFYVTGDAAVARSLLRARTKGLTDFGSAIEPGLRSFLLLLADDHLDHVPWVEAVGMNLTQKPPSVWSDEDLARFRLRLAETAGTIRRLENLYYEIGAVNAKVRSERADAFEAVRVTLTTSAGVESSQVVWVDEAGRQAIADEVDRIVIQIEEDWGPQGVGAFLALLGKRVLAVHDGTRDAEDEDRLHEEV